jgi:hypothetical protein
LKKFEESGRGLIEVYSDSFAGKLRKTFTVSAKGTPKRGCRAAAPTKTPKPEIKKHIFYML